MLQIINGSIQIVDNQVLDNLSIRFSRFFHLGFPAKENFPEKNAKFRENEFCEKKRKRWGIK